MLFGFQTTLRNTRWNILTWKHLRITGCYNDSEKDTVNANTKTCDPKNPPTIVINLDEFNWVLKSCIPANVISERMAATIHDTPVGKRAKWIRIQANPK